MPYPVIPPAQWSVAFLDALAAKAGSKFYQIGWAGHEWDSLLPSHDWSMTAPDANTVRFELRPSDQIPFDINTKTGSERTEIGTVYDGQYQTPPGPGRVPVRTPIAIKYGLTVEPGPQNTAPWLVLSQLHEDEVLGSPPISICLDSNSDVMTVNIGYTDATGKNVNGPIWKDTAPIVRGHRYQMAIYATVDPSGQGRLIVFRDNVKIVDHSGAIGYVGQTNSFWKVGVYRHGPGKETLALRIDNMLFAWGGTNYSR